MGHQVFKFNPDGKVLLTLGTAGVAGTDESHFNQPSDVVTSPVNGDIFVADGHGGATNARIVKFNKDGKFIKAYEVVAATPRSGLYLVLRRTLVVLAIVLPLLFVTGWASVGIWLLPSLAFTTGTLALGGLIGVTRAAYALVAVWGAVFFLPTLAKQEQTFALHPGAIPVWGGVFALTVVVVALRRNAFTRLDAHN